MYMYSRWKSKPAKWLSSPRLVASKSFTMCCSTHFWSNKQTEPPLHPGEKPLSSWRCSFSEAREIKDKPWMCSLHTISHSSIYASKIYNEISNLFVCLLRCNTQLHQFVNIVKFSMCSLALWMPWLCFLNLQIQFALPVKTKSSPVHAWILGLFRA
jgi:hypothetical protein